MSGSTSIRARPAGTSTPSTPRGYYALMHTKAVIVDAEHCIVGSANFTDAGTTRNIEADVLLRNPEFACTLLEQARADRRKAVTRGAVAGERLAPRRCQSSDRSRCALASDGS